MKEFADLHKIIIHFITPVYPQSTASIYRNNWTFSIEQNWIPANLTKNSQNSDISDQMPYAILGCNNSVQNKNIYKVLNQKVETKESVIHKWNNNIHNPISFKPKTEVYAKIPIRQNKLFQNNRFKRSNQSKKIALVIKRIMKEFQNANLTSKNHYRWNSIATQEIKISDL